MLAPAGMADSNRILSQLEYGSTPFSAPLPALQWRPGWLAIVGAVLGMTFLLLAWLAYEAMLAAPAPAPRWCSAAPSRHRRQSPIACARARAGGRHHHQ